jgi:hypothetical protein
MIIAKESEKQDNKHGITKDNGLYNVDVQIYQRPAGSSDGQV